MSFAADWRQSATIAWLQEALLSQKRRSVSFADKPAIVFLSFCWLAWQCTEPNRARESENTCCWMRFAEPSQAPR